MPGFFLDPFRESTGSVFISAGLIMLCPKIPWSSDILNLQDYSSADARVLPNQEGSDLVQHLTAVLQLCIPDKKSEGAG